MTFVDKVLTVIAHCACALTLLRWRGDDSWWNSQSQTSNM